MAKATLNLKSGATVTIEGTPEEVQTIIRLHDDGGKTSNATPSSRAKTPRKSSKKLVSDSSQGIDLVELVNLVKDCDEAEDIEKNILDKISLVDRTLLPLYVVHEHMNNAFTLTSGAISKVTTDLGIPIQQPNVSRTLSGTASKYVMGHSHRKKGSAVEYKLSRRGLQYIKSVIEGKADA